VCRLPQFYGLTLGDRTSHRNPVRSAAQRDVGSKTAGLPFMVSPLFGPHNHRHIAGGRVSWEALCRPAAISGMIPSLT
jgi:hypothetical protein